MAESRLVVKDNALVEASFHLSLTEHRMILLGIVTAREHSILTPEVPIEIKVSAFMEQYDVDKKSAYKLLADATKTLFNRQFSFIDRYGNADAITVSRWVNEVTYVKNQGMVVMYLNRNVINMITRLESHFTKYYVDQVSNLTSQYSIRLFELLSQWLANNVTKKYSLQELRMLLGIEADAYPVMSNFKSRVLDKAVKEITEKSDMVVTYEQFKKGREITHIRFSMYSKKNLKEKQIDRKPLSPKQIDMFSDKLSNLQSFQNHYQADVGASREQYKQKIAVKLEDAYYVEQWMNYLHEVGYR